MPGVGVKVDVDVGAGVEVGVEVGVLVGVDPPEAVVKVLIEPGVEEVPSLATAYHSY